MTPEEDDLFDADMGADQESERKAENAWLIYAESRGESLIDEYQNRSRYGVSY